MSEASAGDIARARTGVRAPADFRDRAQGAIGRARRLDRRRQRLAAAGVTTTEGQFIPGRPGGANRTASQARRNRLQRESATRRRSAGVIRRARNERARPVT